MSRKQKLELTWVGKERRPRLEPRILLEEPELSHHAGAWGGGGLFENRLIQGDNLLALKALEGEFAGRVKCVFIDPPYNTGSAFEHYDDGLEHSLWLSMMRDRLELIRRLLADDGSLWVTLDDNEAHYFKVMADEVFGRANFVANVIWQKKYSPANDAVWLSDNHDHILVYAKEKAIWRPRPLPRSEEADRAYKNPDNDPRGPWKTGDYTCNKSATERPNLYYAVLKSSSGEEIWPKKTAVWRFSKDAHERNVREDRVWWGRNGTNSVPAYKRFRTDVDDEGIVAQTIWLWNEVGHTQDSKKEQKVLSPNQPFATPKPEKLLQRVLDIATRADDLVLDSFAGSGTTGAVAHKMGRRWIMVELGEHARTHVVPRLRKVIDGTDPGGVTETVGWKGGGGFRFYRLAPSLLERDKWGREVISRAYNGAMLAEALCKLEGFTYAPSETEWWNHGRSTERDFLYVTTQTLQHEQLRELSEQVGDERTLLVLCAAYRGDARSLRNLTVRKIPDHVRDRCEWGRDDYSLAVAALPEVEPEPGAAQATLFAEQA